MNRDNTRLSDTFSAIAHAVRRLEDYLIYYEWMEGGDVPMDVTHVEIDIVRQGDKDEAFKERRQLRIVILNDGLLEEIGRDAFRE
jgi:hypothetical protein